VNVIYREPPIVEHCYLGEISRLRTSANIRLRKASCTKPERADGVVTTSTDPPIAPTAISSYA